MSVRRIFQLPLICLLIVSLVTGAASAVNYVWCLSADGHHSALEFAPGGDCSHDDCTALSTLDSEDENCGSCLDITSSHGWNVSPTRHGDPAGANFAEFPPADWSLWVPLPQRILNSHRLIEPPPRIPDPILHHLTIVLLV